MLLLTSCYKSNVVYYDELDATLTQYEVEFDFSTYTDFAMSDSTILVTNYLTDEEIDEFFAPGGTSDVTLEEVKKRFVERDYTFTADHDAADFVAAVTVMLVKQSGAVYYPPGWWWGYPGWGWGGWWGYPGYPGYPGYVQTYSYKIGNLAIEMIDGDSFRSFGNYVPGETIEIPELFVRWVATIDGYVTNNGDYDAQRAQRGLNEAFEQSPYLKK